MIIYIYIITFISRFLYIYTYIFVFLGYYIYSYIHTYTQPVTISGSHTPKAVPWSLFAGKNTGHGGEVASLLGHRQELWQHPWSWLYRMWRDQGSLWQRHLVRIEKCEILVGGLQHIKFPWFWQHMGDNPDPRPRCGPFWCFQKSEISRSFS